MKKGYTDMTILLDRSGSMVSIKEDMEGGFKTFINAQKSLPGTLKVSLFQFDTQFEEIYSGKNVNEIHDLTLIPRGGTALLDSMFKAITKTGERLSDLTEEERPEKVLFVVITDGLENYSHEVTRGQLKDSVKTQTETYKWDFIYLGANQDAFSEGSLVGITTNNVMSFSSTGQSVNSVYTVLNAATTRYRSSEDPSQKDFFKKDEQNQE